MRYKLTIAYDGTDFHGWQKQHPPDAPPMRTVQGVLEEVVRHVVREPVNVLGASRTDSGVHARGQIATFATELDLDPLRMRRAINSRLPEDALVTHAEITRDDFNPISDATSKGYAYVLAHAGPGRADRPLFDRRYVTWTGYTLDAERMKAAATHLVGEHDFASLTRKNHGRESTVRTIHECTVTDPAPDRVRIDVSGNGFLYNMVRIIAGMLLDVGRGRIEPDAIPTILEARDRAAAGHTLGPEGLCLEWVRYERSDLD